MSILDCTRAFCRPADGMDRRTLGLHAPWLQSYQSTTGGISPLGIKSGRMPVFTYSPIRTNGIHNLSTAQKPTVMIIEDDPSVRRALQMQLSVEGFDVRGFSSAEEFLAGNSVYLNGCLLVDVYMPGMSGIALWEHLAAAGRPMPTVLMSGRDDSKTRRLVRRAKGVPCLFKPFDQSALLRAIRKAMRGPSETSQ